MRKVIYPLFCAIALLAILPSSEAAIVSDSLFISPDVDSIEVCPGGNVVLSVVGGSDYSWTPAVDFDDPNGQTVTLTPSFSQWYYVTGTVDSLVCTDSIYVSIPAMMPTFSVDVSSVDTICPLDVVSVTFTGSEEIVSVSWNTTEGVVDSTSTSGSDITPLETTEYIVTALIGPCTVSDTFTINVIPFKLQLITPDTIYLCLDDSTTIRHNILPPTIEVIWSPLDTTIQVQPPSSALVKPTVSMTYTATSMFEECTLSTTTFVRVDSLPDTALVVVPLMDPYCAGEMITIFAERADTLKYPDILFQWQPVDGQIQDSTNTGNVFVVLQDTTTFFRTMTNNACEYTSSVTVNVIPPDIPLSVTDTTLCPGDQFMVEILDPDVTDIEWSPEQGLSCTKCLDPTVTVQGNPITYMVMAKKDRCNVGAQLNVNIFPPLPIIITPSSVQGCPGDVFEFSFDDSMLSNVEVNVTGNASVSCGNCPNPVVTYNGGSVQLTVVADETSDMHCGAFGSAFITMKPDTLQTLPSVIVCANEPTTIPLEQFGFVNPSVSVNVGNLSCNDCLNPIATISQTTTLIVESDSPHPGSCRLISNMILLVPMGDEVNFELGSQPPFGQGEIISITLVTEPPAIPGSVYDWSVDGTPLVGSTSTVTVPLNGLSNMIHVEWMNSFGCVQSADTVITTKPPEVNIPKAFTPDNLETNTHFRVEIIGNIELIEMLVFNRWGQVVYEGTSDEGWDGRRNGKKAPPEVYVYLVKLRYPNGRVETRKGDVTLIR